MACLESLPNEVLFMIINHLSSPELLRTFYGLNRRFDDIIYQLLHRFIVASDFSGDIFEDDLIQFENRIKLISWDIHRWRSILPARCSFPNLQTIILRCSNYLVAQLAVNGESATVALQSYLDMFLRYGTDPGIHDEIKGLANEFSYYPFITHLSMEDCSERDLLYLISRTRNLHYLSVKQLVPFDGDWHYFSSSDIELSSLKKLNISATTKRLNNMNTIILTIQSCQTSLEYLSLEISLDHSLNAYDLQDIFVSCENLTKIKFAFNCWLDDDDEEIDMLFQFQTDWWLDARRPSVLVFHSNPCETLIVSMPCHFDSYIWFPIDLNDWRISKGHLNSNSFYFTKQKSIRLASSHRPLITHDFVSLMGRIFQAPNQELSIPHWEFLSADLLIDQILSKQIQNSILPNVTCLDLNTCNLDQLDPKNLLIWLLLAPNVRVLNICRGTTNAKIQLINRLKTLIEKDQRFKSITDTIEEVHVFYIFDSSSFVVKQHICQMYSTVFRKPVIRR